MDGSLADKVISTACQDWAVFIVSSLKENETSTMIKNIIAKTEYFIFGRRPPPQLKNFPQQCDPPVAS